MKIEADNPEEYIEQLPEDRKGPIKKLRAVILENLSEGFEETMSYGMIGYVVPHSVYPHGYHVDPSLPLPFMSIASQKNYIALYHSGIYVDEDLQEWFTSEYARHVKTNLDMGKSCIRFKSMDQIPYELVGKLTSKTTADQWIQLYEKKIQR